uniref:FATC domain-containing protein n=1 Tax=Mesocestoides corti TaxID=53468 RepID=A0A5K3FIS3_MESCO
CVLQLVNSDIPFAERLKCGAQLCDILENTSIDDELKEEVPLIFVSIQKFLCETEIQFIKEAPLQRLRYISLEILQKIRNADYFRQHAISLLSLLFKHVEQDNEENVLLCIKIVIDVYKLYRPHFSSDVTNFLNFVHRVYRNVKNQMFNIFKQQEILELPTIHDLK